jgi:tetratricopeptide (TPR) repeat protein
MEEMELELSNIRIAWDSSLRHSKFDVLMKMYRPIYTFFETKGWIRESHDFWKNAAEIIGTDLHEKSETAHVHMYGCVLSRLAYTYLVRGQFTQARKTFIRAYDTIKSIHESDETIMILAGLGEVASREGEYETAQQFLRDGLILCKDATDKTAEASLLDSLGIVFMYRGDYDNAQECHEKSMAIWKDYGYQRGIAKNLNNLGNVHYCRGAMDEALFSYEDAITYNTKTGSKRGLRTALSNKGNVLTHKGIYQEAKSIYEECLALAEDLGDLHGVAHAKYQLSITSYSMGDMEGSLRLGKESLAIHEKTGERRGKALVLESLGIASLRMDDLATARDYLEQAILIFGELDARWGLASSLSNLCKVYIAADEWAEARVPIRKAIDIAISIGSDNIIRDTLTLAARLMEHRGDTESAYRILTCIIRNQPTTIKKPTQAEDEITRLTNILEEDARAEIVSSSKDLSMKECCTYALSYLDTHETI